MRLSPPRLLIGALFLAAFGFVMLEGAMLGLFAYAPMQPGSNESALIEVQKGQSPKEVTRALVEAGAIRVSDSDRFLWLGRIAQKWKKLKAGEYKVSASMTPLQIFGVINSGISVAHPVTVREGENMYEVAAELETKRLAAKAAILALCKDSRFISSLGLDPAPETLEGYLFPDTYFFNRRLSPEEMLRQMVRRFQNEWTVKEESRAKALGMTRHQAVTLASIIEKETGAADERPMISSVFHNRLRKKMRLQSDPTTIYGIWESYQGNIKKQDLLSANPYNTYYVPALPAGPISNPGREALQAALFPATSEFLFFVSHNDGTHEFTRSYEDHSRAVRRFQMDRKAREGKSWRDLRKKIQ